MLQAGEDEKVVIVESQGGGGSGLIIAIVVIVIVIIIAICVGCACSGGSSGCNDAPPLVQCLPAASVASYSSMPSAPMAARSIAGGSLSSIM